MANNFKNAVRRNISPDSTLPTEIYKAPDTKKSIAIEIDVSNKSSAGVTVTIQLEDESQNVSTGNSRTVSSAATDTTGTLTTAAAHTLVVNDSVLFHSMGTAPSFTNASLPPSGDAAVSATRMYYVQSASGTSFTIAESKSAASPLTFDVNGGSVLFNNIKPIIAYPPISVKVS